MLQELQKAGKHSFALFPEAKINVGYVTLDATCITQLFKYVYPDHSLCHDTSRWVKNRKGEWVHPKWDESQLQLQSGYAIFNKLFDLPAIMHLPGNNHYFWFSLQTDSDG